MLQAACHTRLSGDGSRLSVPNLAIFPCYSNMLLKKRRWTRIFRQWVLGYASPWLPFLWCYGVFCCSVSLRVILVFKYIIYVIIILYVYDIWLSMSNFDRMCETIDPGSCIRWVLDFVIKTGYDSHAAACWRMVAPGGIAAELALTVQTVPVGKRGEAKLIWYHVRLGKMSTHLGQKTSVQIYR
jgi:hypothetical protein